MDAVNRTDVEIFEERFLREDSPFALTDVDVAGIRCRTYRNGPQNLNDIYRKAALLEKNILALQGGERTSYGETFRRAEKLQQIIADRFGAVRGTRIAIALENGPDWITTFIAITAMGATAVLVGSRDPIALHHCCETARCSLMIEKRGSDLVAVNLRNDDSISLDSIIAQGGVSKPLRTNPASDDEAIIAFTSGSTGLPKAAILTQRGVVTGLLNMMFAGALANVQAQGTRPKMPRRPRSPCVLLLAPLSHIGGYGQMLLTLMIGGKLIFPATEQIDEIMAWIATEKVTSLAGTTPAIIDALLNSLPSRHDITSLMSLNINGISVHPRLVSDIETKLPDVVVNTGYGMTETNGAFCAIAGEMLKRRPRSCGRLVPTVECKVTDESGMPVGPGVCGAVWFRGAMLMRGYSSADAQPFEDGWLNTGDLGYVTEDRHLHILDRRDDFVLAASGKISAQEIEHMIIEHGATEVAVVCSGDRSAPTIFVRPARSVDTDILHIALMSQFGEFKCEIVALEEFPRTLSGKIDRRRLEDRIGST